MSSLKQMSIGFLVLLSLMGCGDSQSPQVVNELAGEPHPATIKGALPFLGESTIVNGDTTYYTVQDFSFINQDSLPITGETVKGKIYVVDFFFTHCPTICPIVKKQMLRVYDHYKAEDNLLFLSHSIDTKYDTVPVLKAFAKKLEVDNSKWHFLTGDHDHIYEMALKYFIAAAVDEDAAGGYTHSGNLMLIDSKRRVRGFYDGTDAEKVDLLISDIDILLKEEQFN